MTTLKEAQELADQALSKLKERKESWEKPESGHSAQFIDLVNREFTKYNDLRTAMDTTFKAAGVDLNAKIDAPFETGLKDYGSKLKAAIDNLDTEAVTKKKTKLRERVTALDATYTPAKAGELPAAIQAQVDTKVADLTKDIPEGPTKVKIVELVTAKLKALGSKSIQTLAEIKGKSPFKDIDTPNAVVTEADLDSAIKTLSDEHLFPADVASLWTEQEGASIEKQTSKFSGAAERVAKRFEKPNGPKAEEAKKTIQGDINKLLAKFDKGEIEVAELIADSRQIETKVLIGHLKDVLPQLEVQIDKIFQTYKLGEWDNKTADPAALATILTEIKKINDATGPDGAKINISFEGGADSVEFDLKASRYNKYKPYLGKEGGAARLLQITALRTDPVVRANLGLITEISKLETKEDFSKFIEDHKSEMGRIESASGPFNAILAYMRMENVVGFEKLKEAQPGDASIYLETGATERKYRYALVLSYIDGKEVVPPPIAAKKEEFEEWKYATKKEYDKFRTDHPTLNPTERDFEHAVYTVFNRGKHGPDLAGAKSNPRFWEDVVALISTVPAAPSVVPAVLEPEKPTDPDKVIDFGGFKYKFEGGKYFIQDPAYTKPLDEEEFAVVTGKKAPTDDFKKGKVSTPLFQGEPVDLKYNSATKVVEGTYKTPNGTTGSITLTFDLKTGKLAISGTPTGVIDTLFKTPLTQQEIAVALNLGLTPPATALPETTDPEKALKAALAANEFEKAIKLLTDVTPIEYSLLTECFNKANITALQDVAKLPDEAKAKIDLSKVVEKLTGTIVDAALLEKLLALKGYTDETKLTKDEVSTLLKLKLNKDVVIRLIKVPENQKDGNLRKLYLSTDNFDPAEEGLNIAVTSLYTGDGSDLPAGVVDFIIAKYDKFTGEAVDVIRAVIEGYLEQLDISDQAKAASFEQAYLSLYATNIPTVPALWAKHASMNGLQNAAEELKTHPEITNPKDYLKSLFEKFPDIAIDTIGDDTIKDRSKWIVETIGEDTNPNVLAVLYRLRKAIHEYDNTYEIAPTAAMDLAIALLAAIENTATPESERIAAIDYLLADTDLQALTKAGSTDLLYKTEDLESKKATILADSNYRNKKFEKTNIPTTQALTLESQQYFVEAWQGF